MSRVVNTNGVGKRRDQLCRAAVLAMREMATQTSVSDEARDLAAFIAAALDEINETIDVTVSAWEKRDYWLKADQFRMQWAWAGSLANKLKAAVLSDDWATVASLMPTLAKNLSGVTLPKRNTLGRPWVGAYQKLRAMK